MTKLRDLKGFEECVPKKKAYPFMSNPDENLSAAKVYGHNIAINQISDVNVVVDEKKLREIIYVQMVSIAMAFNFPNGWSEEKQKVVEIYTDDFTKAIITKFKDFIRLEKSDDK